MTNTVRRKLAVLVSGGGSNLQALIDATKCGVINGEIAVVISSSKDAYAIRRAQDNGIDTCVAARADFGCAEERDGYIVSVLENYKPDYVITAGYLGIITPSFVSRYRNRIVNIHPSLLPLHGGKGMYGIEPHRAAINSGDKRSGATVHFVDEGTDTGAIIMQRSVEIEDGDTPESLQKKILDNIEHPMLVECVAHLCAGRVEVKPDGTVVIKD